MEWNCSKSLENTAGKTVRIQGFFIWLLLKTSFLSLISLVRKRTQLHKYIHVPSLGRNKTIVCIFTAGYMQSVDFYPASWLGEQQVQAVLCNGFCCFVCNGLTCHFRLQPLKCPCPGVRRPQQRPACLQLGCAVARNSLPWRGCLQPCMAAVVFLQYLWAGLPPFGAWWDFFTAVEVGLVWAGTSCDWDWAGHSTPPCALHGRWSPTYLNSSAFFQAYWRGKGEENAVWCFLVFFVCVCFCLFVSRLLRLFCSGNTFGGFYFLGELDYSSHTLYNSNTASQMLATVWKETFHL